MIAHVPAAYVPNASEALVVGGGDGGTARQLLRASVKRVTVVELDEVRWGNGETENNYSTIMCIYVSIDLISDI